MQGVRSRQTFTTKNVFCSKLRIKALVSLMPKTRASLVAPYHKTLPFVATF
jgi:hypothetical protein